MKHYLYHIHREGLPDTAQGYIGVSVDPERRWRQHLAIADNKPENTLKVYSFLRKFRQELCFKLLAEGSLEEIYTLEEKYRPDKGMGWNLARGGDNTHNMHGTFCVIDGTSFISIAEAQRVTGYDYRTIIKMLNGNPTFRPQTEYAHKKAVTLTHPETRGSLDFQSIQEAWGWLGRQGNASGNIAKQTKKGRTAYGYYWKY